MVEDAVGVAGGLVSMAGVVRVQVQRLPALLGKSRGDRGEHAQQGRDGMVPDGQRDVIDGGGEGGEGVCKFDEVRDDGVEGDGGVEGGGDGGDGAVCFGGEIRFGG